MREWLYQLYGRSGSLGMGDVAPVSWQTIESWARVTGIRPTPDEVDALMLLDGVLRKAAADAREKDAPKSNKAKAARGRG